MCTYHHHHHVRGSFNLATLPQRRPPSMALALEAQIKKFRELVLKCGYSIEVERFTEMDVRLGTIARGLFQNFKKTRNENDRRLAVTALHEIGASKSEFHREVREFLPVTWNDTLAAPLRNKLRQMAATKRSTTFIRNNPTPPARSHNKHALKKSVFAAAGVRTAYNNLHDEGKHLILLLPGAHDNDRCHSLRDDKWRMPESIELPNGPDKFKRMAAKLGCSNGKIVIRAFYINFDHNPCTLKKNSWRGVYSNGDPNQWESISTWMKLKDGGFGRALLQQAADVLREEYLARLHQERKLHPSIFQELVVWPDHIVVALILFQHSPLFSSLHRCIEHTA